MLQFQKENEKFLIRVLERHFDCNYDEKNMFMDGKDQILGLKHYINQLAAISTEKYDENNIKVWLPVIIAAMNKFLDSDNLLTTPSYRQAIYETLLDICKEIADTYWDHAMMLDVIKELESPIQDPITYIVKAMHEGVSKKEISEELQITPRAALNYLRRLDIKNKGKVAPLKIGGQSIYLDIVPDRRCGDDIYKKDWHIERDYYKTPNTMHPFVMQYNVTQAKILLNSLYLYWKETNEEICYKMAVDAWCQLSWYGQRKIIEVFGKSDPEFNEFLTWIGDATYCDKLLVFEPEDVFLKEKSYANTDEQIHTAVKGGNVCRVVFFSSAKKETLYGQRILEDAKGFYAVPQKEVKNNTFVGNSEKQYLNADDIKCIIKEYD